MARKETGGEQGCRTGEAAGPVVGGQGPASGQRAGPAGSCAIPSHDQLWPHQPSRGDSGCPRPFAQIPGLPGPRCGGLRLWGRCGGMPLRGALKTGEKGAAPGGLRSRAGTGQATSWAEPILPHDGGEGLAGGRCSRAGGSRGQRARRPCSPSEVGLATRGQLSLLACCPLAVWPQTERRTKAEAPAPEWTRGTKSPHLAQAGLIPPEETHDQLWAGVPWLCCPSLQDLGSRGLSLPGYPCAQGPACPAGPHCQGPPTAQGWLSRALQAL